MNVRPGRLPAPRPPTDDEVAAARLGRPLVRLIDVDGLPALVCDPQGRDDDLDDVLAAFRAAVGDAQRAAIVAESWAAGVERTARRWAVSARSLKRWRAESGRRLLVVEGPKSRLPVTCAPAERPHDEDSGGRGRSVRRAS